MTVFDITVPISAALPVYEGDPLIRITRPANMDKGDDYTVSRLDLSAHTGTHVDAPLHFIPGGNTIDRLELDVLIGPARVVDFPPTKDEITAADFANLRLPVERLLLKTRNSTLWSRPGFQKDYVGLSESGAQWLVDHGVRLVGIDYLSIERFASAGFPVHRTLLAAGVVILEGIDLSRVNAAEYQLICLPMKLEGAEGAPARAVLVAR